MIGQGISWNNGQKIFTSGLISLIPNRDIFSATSGQTVFNCSFLLGNYDIFINGYLITTGFTKTGATQITFDNPQDENTEIVIQNYSVAYASLKKNTNSFSATAGQTVFTCSFLLGNYYDIFIDGYLIVTGFTKTDVSEITFNNAQAEGTQIIIQNYELI